MVLLSFYDYGFLELKKKTIICSCHKRLIKFWIQFSQYLALDVNNGVVNLLKLIL